MFTGLEIVSTFNQLGVTHVAWVPDSVLGRWEAALEASSMHLVRVCREGEIWPLAAGLVLGGKRPVGVMQVTGLFESGDALRNVCFDLKLPVYALLGARSWLAEDIRDSARKFTLPILDVWGLDRVVIERPEDKPKLVEHYRRCREAGRPGVALIAEG